MIPIPGHLTQHLVVHGTGHPVIAWQVSYEVFGDLEQLAVGELYVAVMAGPGVYVLYGIIGQHL
jgi:hypothetical protein